MKIDLHGLPREEAKKRLLIYLKNSHERGYFTVAVIHGHGTGRLKHMVWSLAEKLHYVKSIRFGSQAEGGDSVTIIEFKD